MIFPDYLNEFAKDRFQLELILDDQSSDKSIYKSKINILDKFFFICEGPFDVEILSYELINGKKYGFSIKIPAIPFENMNANSIIELFNEEINQIKSSQ